MKRTPLKRKTPLKRTAISRKPGKKVKAWDAARKKLKVAFEEAGLTSCEIRRYGCWGNRVLSFAHAEKRRFITTPEQLNECVVACAACHLAIEMMSHASMARIVREIIANRETQPQLPAR